MKVKKTYQFTLILNNVDENTPNLEDSLYEAGCDDALINFREGAVYLDFDREGTSLEDSVIQAIHDVESASIGAKVINVTPEDLVTESEVAARLHLKRQAVSLWIKKQRRTSTPFPKPIMKLSERSPLWRWREIVEWLYRNKMIDNKELLTEAAFLEDIRVVLEERWNKKIRTSRKTLLQKLETLA